MKKGFLFFALFAAILLLASCPMEVDNNIGGGDNPGITWTDPAFGIAARKALDKADGASVTPTEAATITNLNLAGRNITKLDDIKHFPALITLNLSYTTILDAKNTPTVATLTNLTSLNLSGNEIVDISNLPTMAPKLTKLYLSDNKITNIEAFKTFTNFSNLITLDLSNNQISDLSAFTDLKNTVGTINLTENTGITDWSPVPKANITTVLGRPTVMVWVDAVIETATRTKLGKLAGDITTTEVAGIESLSITSETITNLDDIKYFTGLTDLTLNGTGINDITALTGLVAKLTNLNLSNNTITDISALSDLPDSTTLDLTGNTSITDWRHIDHVTNVTGIPPAIVWVEDEIEDEVRKKLGRRNGIIRTSEVIGITDLYISFAYIDDITDISHLTGLKKLNLIGNDIIDISPLTALAPNLTNLNLSGNDIIDISPLTALAPNLTNLNLSGNDIIVISPLTGLKPEAIVNLNYNDIDDATGWIPVAHVQSVEGRPEAITWVIADFEAAVRVALNRPNGLILKVEVASETTLDLSNKIIANLADIVHFKGLTTLDLTGNTNITSWNWENWLPADHVASVTGRPPHITWTDENLEEAVRAHLNRTAAGLVFESEVETITNLDASSKGITKLDDIAHFTALTTLDLRGNPSITDWTPVNGVTTVQGKPTAVNPTRDNYAITTPEELLWIATQTSDFSGKTVEFTVATIDMEGQAFSGIPTFAGIMTGTDTGTTITNLKIESQEELVGFIRELKGGTIQNLIIDSASTIQGVKIVGSFVGIATDGSTLKNLTNEASVTVNGTKNYKEVGGIIGKATSATIQKAYNFGDLTVGNETFGAHVGGIIGTATSATITNVSNSATVTVEEGNSITVGGIIADSSKCTIEFAENFGTVTVAGKYGSTVGGIVGDADGTWSPKEEIRKVMNFGNITATGSDAQVGGIIGKGSTIKIIDAANVGTITGHQRGPSSSNDAATGGILGTNVNVDMTRVYNYGEYSGSWAGSIAGLLTTTITTEDVVVKGDAQTAPYGGWVDFGVSDVLPSPSSYLPEEEFKDISIFISNDWKNWEIKTNALYPTLKPLVP